MPGKVREPLLYVDDLKVANSLTVGGTNITASIAEVAALNGLTATVAELNKTDGVTGSLVEAHEVTFTEDGEGVYTGSVSVPAGATIIDIIVNAVALWAAGTSAAMIVGDGTDPNGYYDAINLKATDLLAGESISFALAGGKAGAYIANSQVSPRYSSSARTITGEVTSTGAGTTGRTRMIVIFALPTATAATKA